MQFTYKNPNVYDKKYAILKDLEVEKKVQKDNEKYIKYSLLKKEYSKIYDNNDIHLFFRDSSFSWRWILLGYI